MKNKIPAVWGILLLIFIALLLCLLTGCGSEEQPPPDKDVMVLVSAGSGQVTHRATVQAYNNFQCKSYSIKPESDGSYTVVMTFSLDGK